MRTIFYQFCVTILLIVFLVGCQAHNSIVDEPVEVMPLATATRVAREIHEEVIEENKPKDLPITAIEVEKPNPEVFFGLDCGEAFCSSPWIGLLERPIGEGYTRRIDTSYPFASVGDGTLDPHHGVEFPNKFGTPVLAAQDGEVIFAGTDEKTKLGFFWNFYGNVVILHHPGLVDEQRDVFTLYGHLSEIHVKEGEHVSLGDEVGKVGSSGAAIGQHLHFEVRIDENSYDHTVNPVVWFAPLVEPGHGQLATLTGLIRNQFGEPIPELQLTLEKLTDNDEFEKQYYPKTYHPMKLTPQPLLGENFAIPDLPPGRYRLSFIAGTLNHYVLTLEPGELGFFSFIQTPNAINNEND